MNKNYFSHKNFQTKSTPKHMPITSLILCIRFARMHKYMFFILCIRLRQQTIHNIHYAPFIYRLPRSFPGLLDVRLYTLLNILSKQIMTTPQQYQPKQQTLQSLPSHLLQLLPSHKQVPHITT